MAQRVIRAAMGIVLAGVLACACTTTVDDPSAEETSGTGTETGTTTGSGTPTAMGTGTGCGAGPMPLESTSTISECGGFDGATDGSGSGAAEPPPYCDAEVLHWSYDPTLGTLELLDARVELNCCGDHSMTLTQLDGSYIVTETDAPEGEYGRCNCSCVFDFALSASDIPNTIIHLQLVRTVTDEGAPYVAFEGLLDLREGSGWEIVDDEPAMFCGDGPL